MIYYVRLQLKLTSFYCDFIHIGLIVAVV